MTTATAPPTESPRSRRRYSLQVYAAGARILTADRLTWGALAELLDEHWPEGARAELRFSHDT
jgi:hypothetical protein